MERNKLAIGTYSLERAKVRTGQDMERKQASNRYLLPGEGKGQDWSGHGMKQASNRYLLAGEGKGQDWLGHRKKES